MPILSDLGGMFNTLRELDVSAIEEEGLRQFTIACVGEQQLCLEVVTLLYNSSASRFGSAGPESVVLLTPQLADRTESLDGVDLVMVVLDAREQPRGRTREALGRLFARPIPQLVVLLYSEGADFATLPAHIRAVALPAPDHLDAQTELVAALIEQLPRELIVAAARHFPALRSAVGNHLIQAVSMANASYALVSSLPQQLPLLSLPFAAADILVLTKNQTLMVYRLALAHGAPADFQAHLREMLPVVGGAYIWRHIARTLIGLIPGWGVVPKVSVAYAGTYTTGIVAVRWYGHGELIEGERLRQLAQESLERARTVAIDLAASARERGDSLGRRAKGFLRQVRLKVPARFRSTTPDAEERSEID